MKSHWKITFISGLILFLTTTAETRNLTKVTAISQNPKIATTQNQRSISTTTHTQSRPQQSILIVFWNTENFFDYAPETNPKKYWTRKRFIAKSNGIFKTIMLISELHGRIPDAIGFCEVGDRKVLEKLIGLTPLRKIGYRIIHFDSPDRRGIDCALLYRPESLCLKDAAPKHLTDSAGNVLPTRDILLARFDSLAILVNHHPSKLGSGTASDGRRAIAMARLRGLCDSLETAGCPRWVAVGDFNDDLWHRADAHGTIKYNGRWEKIDGCFHQGWGKVEESVFAGEMLLERDRSFGGMKPRRTFVGPRYNGGISDHLPIVLEMFF